MIHLIQMTTWTFQLISMWMRQCYNRLLNLFPRLPLLGQSMFGAVFLWISGMPWHASKFQKIMDLPAHLHGHFEMPYLFLIRMTKPRLLHTLQQLIHLGMRCSDSMQNGFGDIASGLFTHLKISFLWSMKSTKHLVHYVMQPPTLLSSMTVHGK